MSQTTNNRIALLLAIAIIVSMVLGAAAGGLAGGIAGYALASRRVARPVAATYVAGEPAASSGGATSVLRVEEAGGTIDAVKKTGPAVVTIITTLQQATGPRALPLESTASGSGIILDATGNILTNNHVVEGQKKIVVIFADGEQADARLVGGDSLSDLAVIKVERATTAVAELGDSDTLSPGQHVLAIGSALGDFRNTVTAGIVSGLGRALTGVDYRLDDLIQTDAAINHGNSGGPLINLAGQVIGINVAIYRGSAVSGDSTVEGVGFAIPINTARLVSQQIIANGKVVRPYIGVSYVMLTPQLASFYKASAPRGAYLSQIVANTPAARAGLKEQDVVTAVGDRTLNDSYSLFTALLRYKPGDTVEMKVTRGGKELTVTVALAERPPDVK